MKKIFILLPSRDNRPSLWNTIDSWEKTSNERSSLIVIIDKDQKDLYHRMHEDIRMGLIWVVVDRQTLVEKLNSVSRGVLRGDFGDPLAVGFVGDDCIFQTDEWELRVTEELKNNKGMVYCNDLLQKELLPNNIFIHTDIIKPLGFMAPSVLSHYFIDNYWKDLGTKLHNLHYFADIIIEHNHWSNGKAIKDALYLETEKLLQPDQDIYRQYINSGQLSADALKVQLWKQLNL